MRKGNPDDSLNDKYQSYAGLLKTAKSSSGLERSGRPDGELADKTNKKTLSVRIQRLKEKKK